VSVADALDGACRTLAIAGIRNPRWEARLVASHALGITIERMMAYPEDAIDNERKAYLDEMVSRRAGREPLAYIVGHREFWSLPFCVTPYTLVPRPDTECLVEAALYWLGKKTGDVRILDLGTGTGCVLLALLNERSKAWGVGVDVSMDALRVACKNASALQLADRANFVQSDWGSGLTGGFDVVVSNPPYIADGDFTDLEPEVTHFEPRLALSGGADGLSAYRAVVPRLRRLLAPGGAAFLEIGAGAAENVTKLIRQHGFEHIEIKNDFARIPRCVRITKTI
jgi:release factor glutamine methyltransferase